MSSDLLEIARAATPATAPDKPTGADPYGWGYNAQTLREIDALIRELGDLEGWTDAEIEAKLAERQRMAPRRVPGALEHLKTRTAEALKPWPNRPAKRSSVALCVIDGGKSSTPEAA